MRFELENILKRMSDKEYEQWNEFVESLICEYTICTDTIEIDGHEIELWCYDSDLEDLFYDHGIEVGKALNVEKTFDYDEDFQPIGLDYGDYIETRELVQNGKTYLVPIYCAYNGSSCDYGFAIFKVEKGE